MKAEDFELKYSEISAKIEQNAMRLIELKEAEERRTLIKERVTEFCRLLQKNEILTKFDRTIFESIVENVIIGGFDEKGRKDPYQISFVYKMGFSDLANAKKNRIPRKVRVNRETGEQNLCIIQRATTSVFCVAIQFPTHIETLVCLARKD